MLFLLAKGASKFPDRDMVTKIIPRILSGQARIKFIEKGGVGNQTSLHSVKEKSSMSWLKSIKKGGMSTTIMTIRTAARVATMKLIGVTKTLLMKMGVKARKQTKPSPEFKATASGANA